MDTEQPTPFATLRAAVEIDAPGYVVLALDEQRKTILLSARTVEPGKRSIYAPIRETLAAHAIKGGGLCAGAVEWYSLYSGEILTVTWLPDDRVLFSVGESGLAF